MCGRSNRTLLMRLLLVDDHPPIRDALTLLLRKLDRQIRVDEAGDCAEAIAHADRQYDLIVLDMKLPGLNGLDALAAIREAFPATRVCVLSGDEDPDLVHRAIEQGAMGYITKSSTSEVIIQALRLVLADSVYLPEKVLRAAPDRGRIEGLTARQMDVVRRLVEGKPNKIIAQELDISESTCKLHVSDILRKLDLDNRVQLVIHFAKQGLRLG